ncbi:hypothetical protein ACODT5_43495 [Streptomyces sp. 5.8]|uniref:hypothetical protein n=1 Tax=Streptomyces sp. 5.8 TaxID=3406571 RepID=UPI003BB72667
MKPGPTVLSTGAAWMSFLTPALAVGGQLFAFQVLSATWSVVVGVVVGIVFQIDQPLSDESDEDEFGLSLVGFWLALLAGMAVAILLLWAPGIPWWVGVLALCVMGPLAFWTATGLTRLFEAVTRAEEAAFVANTSGIAAGLTTASLLLARTDLAVVLVPLAGLLTWIVAGVAVSLLLPPRRY